MQKGGVAGSPFPTALADAREAGRLRHRQSSHCPAPLTLPKLVALEAITGLCTGPPSPTGVWGSEQGTVMTG